MNYYNYPYGNTPNQFNQNTAQTNMNTNNPISTNNVFQNQSTRIYPYIFQSQPSQASLNSQSYLYQQMMQMTNNNNNTQQPYSQQPIIVLSTFQNHQNLNNVNRSPTLRRTSYPPTVRNSLMQQQYIQQQNPQRMMYNCQNIVHPESQASRITFIPNAYNYPQFMMENSVSRTPYTQNTRIVTPIIPMTIDRSVRRPLADATYPPAKRSSPCGNVNKLSILYMKTRIDPNSTADKDLDEDYINRPYYRNTTFSSNSERDSETTFFKNVQDKVLPCEYDELKEIIQKFIDKKLSLYEFDSMMTSFLSFDNELLDLYKEVFKERGLPDNISEYPSKYASIKGIEYTDTDSPSYFLVKNDPNIVTRDLIKDQKPYCDLVKELNDNYIAYSEGSRFKNRDQNEYEFQLINAEDCKYEIDMKIENIKNCIDVLSVISDELEKEVEYRRLKPSELSDLNKMTIRLLYMNYGNRMLKLMFEAPQFGVPIVLDRLREKLSDWFYIRDIFDSDMKIINEKNYSLSYDVRSKTFLEDDRKRFSRKGVIETLNNLTCKNDEFISTKYHTLPISYSIDLYEAATDIIKTTILRETSNKKLYKDFFYRFLAGFYNILLIDTKRIPIGGSMDIYPYGVGIIREYNGPYIKVQYEGFTIQKYLPIVNTKEECFEKRIDQKHCIIDDRLASFCFTYTLFFERLEKLHNQFPNQFESVIDLITCPPTNITYQQAIENTLGYKGSYLLTMPDIVKKIISEIKDYNDSFECGLTSYYVYMDSILPVETYKPEDLYKRINAKYRGNGRSHRYYCKLIFEKKCGKIVLYNTNPDAMKNI